MENSESEQNVESDLPLNQVSELPEDIMQHIFTFLEREKDKVRASSLSKKWLNAWQTRPVLHFNEKGFYHQDLGIHYIDRDKFLNYVNSSLQRYREENICIKKLKLEMVTSIVDEWIHVAIQNGVKELEIRDGKGSCSWPSVIFEAKSLLEVLLQGFGSKLELPQIIKCNNLKSLHLRFLCLDESSFASLISSCQMIENLELWYCEGIDDLKLFKTPMLKKFLFHPMPFNLRQNLEILEAPNLEFLACDWCCNLKLGSSQNLKQLELLQVDISDEFLLDFKSKFPHLEHLKLHLCRRLERIRISSESLREMDLKIRNEDVIEELYIDAPNMTRFEYNGCSLPASVSFPCVSNHCCSRIYYRQEQNIN